MGMALHRFKIGEQTGVVDRGRDLTDAAADSRHGHAAGGIDLRLLVALFRGAHADRRIEGEDLAGQDDGAVHGLAGQNQVIGAGRVVGVVGVHVDQRVAEEHLFQLACRDLGLDSLQLDAVFLALPGLIEPGLHVVAVEAKAGDIVDDFAVALVHGGVGGLAAVGLVQGLHIHLLRVLPDIGHPRRQGAFALRRCIAAGGFFQGLGQKLLDLGGVDGAAGHAGADDEDAAFAFPAAAVGSFLHGGLGERGAVVCGGLHGEVVDGVFTVDQVVRQIHGIVVRTELALAGVQILAQRNEVEVRADVRRVQGQNDGLLRLRRGGLNRHFPVGGGFFLRLVGGFFLRLLGGRLRLRGGLLRCRSGVGVPALGLKRQNQIAAAQENGSLLRQLLKLGAGHALGNVDAGGLGFCRRTGGAILFQDQQDTGGDHQHAGNRGQDRPKL